MSREADTNETSNREAMRAIVEAARAASWFRRGIWILAAIIFIIAVGPHENGWVSMGMVFFIGPIAEIGLVLGGLFFSYILRLQHSVIPWNDLLPTAVCVPLGFAVAIYLWTMVSH